MLPKAWGQIQPALFFHTGRSQTSPLRILWPIEIETDPRSRRTVINVSIEEAMQNYTLAKKLLCFAAIMADKGNGSDDSDLYECQMPPPPLPKKRRTTIFTKCIICQTDLIN